MITLNTNSPLHRPAGTGDTYIGPGDSYRFLVTGEETGGAYFAMEALVPPGGGPPPHIHHNEDETFYVVEGEVTIRLGEGRTVIAGVGDFVNVPRGSVHCFKNEGTDPARMILTFTPAGMERFFEETLERAADPNQPPPSDNHEAVAARYVAAAARYGLEFIVHMSPQANRDETTMTARRGPAAPPRGAARGPARAPRAAGATTQRAAGATAHRLPRQTRPVGDSFTVPLDAEPQAVVAALDRVDLAAPVARALEALGLAGRVVLSPAVLGPAGGGGLALGLIWRIGPTAPEQRVEPHAFEAFGSRGHVKVRWEVQVRAAGDGGSFLSIATRFTATDDDSRARLLDAWGLVGPLSRSLARRAARTVQARAEAAQQNEMAA